MTNALFALSLLIRSNINAMTAGIKSTTVYRAAAKIELADDLLIHDDGNR